MDAAVAKADAAAPRRQAPAQPSMVAANAPPVVAILEPGDNARVEGDLVRVHYLVEARAGSRIARVRILVDGQEVLAQPGFEVASDDGVDRWLPVPVGPKAQRLAIIAEGEQGSSDPAAIRLQPSAPEQGRKPNLWVLAAGVSTYTNQPNLKLNFAAQDAADFVAALKRQAHGPLYDERRGPAPARRRGAPGDALDGGLQWLDQKVQPGDVAMVFFSGHGADDRYGNLSAAARPRPTSRRTPSCSAPASPTAACSEKLVPLAKPGQGRGLPRRLLLRHHEGRPARREQGGGRPRGRGERGDRVRLLGPEAALGGVRARAATAPSPPRSSTASRVPPTTTTTGCCASASCAATSASRWTRSPTTASSRSPRSPRSASATRRCSSCADRTGREALGRAGEGTAGPTRRLRSPPHLLQNSRRTWRWM